MIRYLAALIGRGRRIGTRIGTLHHPEAARFAKRLTDLSKAVSMIPYRAVLLNPERGLSGDLFDLLNEYIGAYFLIEIRTYYAILNEVEHHIDDLRSLYLLIGELDALQSVASFRIDLPNYVEPELLSMSVFIELREGKHPLLAEPVPNSIMIEKKGIFVTGSNMAGKSTFLRTVATNCILAQTIFTCYASGYRGGFFKVMSSINIIDQLEQGKSYYLREAERLLHIINALDNEVPCLCIIDDLLLGTNSAERINASVEILDYLCQRNAVTIVTSHDIELARMLQDVYENYHFSYSCDESGLHFDYSIKNGISSTKNAIRLMGMLGYPQEIVDQAEARLRRYFEETEGSRQ